MNRRGALGVWGLGGADECRPQRGCGCQRGPAAQGLFKAKNKLKYYVLFK